MFAARRGDYVIGYESGPIPTWKARRCAIRINILKEDGYSPWRYRHMTRPKNNQPEIRYEIEYGEDRESM